MSRLEPLKVGPSMRERVWGARNLAPVFGPVDRRIGEAWYFDNDCQVAHGPLAGRTIASLVREYGEHLLGRPQDPPSGATGGAAFPILAKLLFAADRLSIQVHPGDELTGNGIQPGKTELWYVIDAGSGAELGLGLAADRERSELAAAAANGTIESSLRWIPAKTGEAVLLPAGTVHSARGPVVLCEIQQNSDTTYRLYDYGRNGLDGRPRALQVGRAVEAADLTSRPDPGRPALVSDGPCRIESLGRCPHFVAELLRWDRPFLYAPDPKRCHILVCLSGDGSLNGVSFGAGDAFLVPAEAPRFPADGSEARAVRAYSP